MSSFLLAEARSGNGWLWMTLRMRVPCTRTETSRPPNGKLDANASYWHTIALVLGGHNVDERKYVAEGSAVAW